MQSLLLFRHDLECHKEKNIKYHYQLMASTIWEFALRIAEKFFLYTEDAQEYAKKILFMDLHNPFDITLRHIQQDFMTNQIAYNDAEMYSLFVDAYQKAKETINHKENVYL